MPDPLAGLSIGFAILFSIVAAALFSALETVLAGFGEARLLAEKDMGGADGETAARVVETSEALAARLLAADIMGVVVAAGLAVYLADHLADGQAGAVKVFGAIGAVAILYGLAVMATRAFFSARSHLLLRWLRWVRPFELLMWPLGAPLSWIYRFVNRLAFVDEKPDPEGAVREVEHMIEMSEEIGGITGELGGLLKGVLEFKDTVAREVMVPRTRMVAFELSTSIEEVLTRVEEEGHSRYPIYRERVDEVEGVLYTKDLFGALRAQVRGEPVELTLESLIRRPPFFVAESHKIGSLLREMQTRRFHLAVVVDEFGGTSGIVTLEDILEEIVGEIEDEHDDHEDLIQELEPGQKYLADATVSIYDLGDRLQTALGEDGRYDSLGGMIVEKLENRVPQAGQCVTVGAFDFIVREADEKHVTRVEIVRRSEPAPALVE